MNFGLEFVGWAPIVLRELMKCLFLMAINFIYASTQNAYD